MLALHDPVALAGVFSVLVHAALIAAVLGKFVLLGTVIISFSNSWQERIMRSIASMAGLLLYVGSTAAGLSIPAFMLHALTTGGALMTGLVGAMLPGAAGFVVAWFSCRYFSSRDARRNAIAMRVLTMVLTISVFLFLDVYIAAATNSSSLSLLMPNMVFALAIMLVAVFRFHALPEIEAKTAA
jgi:hypothetical protein